MKLSLIKASSIVNSRGEKAVKVTLSSEGDTVSASVPCGKSKGENEAFCHTVEHSIDLIEALVPVLKNKEFQDLKQFDEFLNELDGTVNKSKLGSNVTLSLSIAFCRLFALKNKTPIFQLIASLTNSTPAFPKLFFNIINGGLHVDTQLNPVPFQEYLLIPTSSSPQSATVQALLFIDLLKERFEKESKQLRFGDEGGFVLSDSNPELGLKMFSEVFQALPDNLSGNFKFGLDVAASSFWSSDGYKLGNQLKTAEQMLQLYKYFSEKYSLLSIEDPFDQEDWKPWAKLKSEIGNKVWVVGDDLTVTNTRRIKEAKEKGAINAMLIKPNQIGTISETVDAINLAKKLDWKIIVSHRSGETNDSFIADLAYGSAADGLKAGSPLQGQRISKYNRLMQIEYNIAEGKLK